MSKDTIEKVNSRRFFLIEKEMADKLTTEEDAELALLQLRIDELVDAELGYNSNLLLPIDPNDTA